MRLRPPFSWRLAVPAALVLTLCLPTPSSAQEDEAVATDRPTMSAKRVPVAPVLDGDVLGDEVWDSAVPATSFFQTTPNEGQPASERTEIFVVTTNDTIYFGIVCHDSDPDGIIVSDTRRDSSLTESDSLQIIIDTYRDRQTGFVFGTNPAGVEYDGQVIREGQGGFRGAGGFNINWDGDWEVRSQISDIGWSAEIAIPFRTLRFPRGTAQVWGINFQRNIRRRNENAFWAPLPRQFGLYRLSMAGTIGNLEVPSQRNLKVTPYVLAMGREEGVEDAEQESDADAGLDIKWSITPSMTVDATVNTDFAQVEVDELQINLDRFNLFFPEKRPFFLENAGLFTVGVPQELELFYSRRIGLGPDGEEVPIDYGLRLSGKSGKYNVGMIYMQADEVANVAPQNDFAVARVSRDLPNRSSIGGIFIDRRSSGQYSEGDDTNQTFAIDGQWGIGQNTTVSGFVAQTRTPGEERDEHAFRLGTEFSSEQWSYQVHYTEVAEGFNPEVGFLTRSAFRKGDAFVLRTIRPKDLWGLQELRPHISYNGYWDFDGFQESSFLHFDNHWEFKSGYEIHTGFNVTSEGLKEPFEISDGIVVPVGTYDNYEGAIVFFTNRGAPVSFNARIVAGGFFDGDRFSASPGLNFRIGDKFTNAISWQYNDIDLEGGAFKTNLGRLRTTYSFTPRIFAQALVQYNDRADLWATNLRFGWLQRANTGLYVVYNEVRDIGMAGTGIPDRSLTLKYSRMFDLLR